MTDIASLALRVDSVEAKQAASDLDKLASSGEKAGAVADLMQKQFGKLMAVLGPSALAAAFLLNIKHSIALQEQYVRLSEVAGTTASVMSSFDLPARLSSTGLDTVATSIARLSKAIGEARLDKTGESARLLKALGIDPDDGRDAAAVFVDVSKALVGMKDQNIAAAASMPLLSRGFSEMRPLMKEIVEQGTLNARATDDQLAASKRLADDLVKLKFQFDENTFSLVEGLTPAMQDVMKATTDAAGGARNLNEAGELTGTMLKGVASLGLAAFDIFFGLGHQIGGLAAAIAAASRGEFQIAFDLINEVDEEVEKHTVDTNERIRKIWEGTAKAARDAATGGGAGAAGGTGSASEAAVRQLMLDKKNYEARIAMLTAFGAQYADQIKTANILAEEAFKQGGIDNLRTQTELMQQQAALNADNLRQQAAILGQRRDESLGQGNLAKAAEAAGAIEQINAQIVASEAITQARIQSLRTVTAMKQQEEYNAWLTGVLARGEALAASFGTEREIEDRAYQEKLQALDVYLKESNGQVANAAQLRERLELEHQAKLGDLFAQGALERMKFDAMTWDMQAKTAAGAIVAITQGAASGNKTMFEINKLAALADIVVSTSQGVMKAWGQGGWFGYGMAALIAAAGAVNFHRVQQTHFGGAGGVAASVSGSAGGAMPTFPTGPGAGTAAAPPSAPSVTVIVQGHFIGTQEFMDNVVLPSIRDAADNREFLLFDPVNSQQAQRMVPA